MPIEIASIFSRSSTNFRGLQLVGEGCDLAMAETRPGLGLADGLERLLRRLCSSYTWMAAISPGTQGMSSKPLVRRRSARSAAGGGAG